MKYNYRQQSALAGEFVEVLSIERNLGVKTLYAYKNDVDNMVKWIDMRGYSDLDADTNLPCINQHVHMHMSRQGQNFLRFFLRR